MDIGINQVLRVSMKFHNLTSAATTEPNVGATNHNF